MSGQLFIVAAPSGAGKTTLTRMLLERDAQIRLSISYTTRAPRPGEQDGREYHFIDEAAFTRMREAGDFLEWAHVHGNYYGTSKAWIDARRAAGEDVLLEIDWQGAQQVMRLIPEAIGIFILPPSVAELKRRLEGRGQDSAEVIARRLAAAEAELRHVDEFAYAIINENLDCACADLMAVVRAARVTVAVQRVRRPDLFLSPLSN